MDRCSAKRHRSKDIVETPQFGSSSPAGRNDNLDVHLGDIVSDPGLRKQIVEFDVNLRDHVRREYIAKGPCRLKKHLFPIYPYGSKRCFWSSWYDQFDWLEYSEYKDAAFCFICYLFGPTNPTEYVDDTFTKLGFNNWEIALKKFREHVGAEGSVHNNARTSFNNFRKQRLILTLKISSGSVEHELAYKKQRMAILDVICLLLKQGLSFGGRDESPASLNMGNFLGLLDFLGEEGKEIRRAINEDALGSSQMTFSSIQKKMVRACAMETLNVILSELGQKKFTLLVDESQDVLVVILRYVNDHGAVIERFFSLVHVKDMCVVCLMDAVENLFAINQLSLSNLRGQGYNGASNMREEFSGLRSLILKENPDARYVHCFARQLQLIVVATSRENRYINDLFCHVRFIVDMIALPCKGMDSLRHYEHERILQMLELGEATAGRAGYQATNSARPGDTRWGSLYRTLVCVQLMWPSVIKVLENVLFDGTGDQRGMAETLLDKMEDYMFVFMVHLMIRVMEITNILSSALEDKSQNMVQALSMIETTKSQLKRFKEVGWELLLEEVGKFCKMYSVDVVNMDDYAKPFFSRRLREGGTVTNHHLYRNGIFCQVLDSIILEMESLFAETSTEVLLCMACLDPSKSFAMFNFEKLVRLAELCPEDFSIADRARLPSELQAYYLDMTEDVRFDNIQNIQDLSKKMVESGKARAFPLVYRLIELALLLPVETATVERFSSAMKVVKSDVIDEMDDGWSGDSLLVYLEKEIFLGIDKELILHTFQNLCTDCL